MSQCRRWAGAAWLAAALLHPAAHAGLFDDDEARRAILDLRQKLEQLNEQQRARQGDLNTQLQEQINQLKRGLLDLNNQLDVLRADNSKLRGLNEQLARDVAEMQRRMKDVQQGVDERVRKLEPQKVMHDGREILVEPDEKRLYDEAFALFRKGDFAASSVALAAFRQRYPASGYNESALFWLGNAQYAKREYKEAITSFRALVAAAPESVRAAESLLAVANCQIELKDNKAARRSIEELVKAYPQSEAAQAGKERLAALK